MGKHEGVLVIVILQVPPREIHDGIIRVVELDPISRIQVIRGVVVYLIDHDTGLHQTDGAVLSD